MEPTQHQYARSATRIAILLVCAVWAAVPAWADSEPLLRLEPAPGHSGQSLPLAHPAEISGDHLTRLLSSLEYRESGLLGRASRQTVFSAEELSRLAPLMAEALGRAGASEQVRFASFARRSGVLSQLLKTEAVVFVDAESRLNVAFVSIHEFAGPDTDFFAFLELSDRDPLATERSLLRLDGSAPGWSVQARRPLWVQAGPSAAPVAVSTRAEQAMGTEAAAPEKRGQVSEPAPADAPEPGGNRNLEAEVRQRLEFLLGLYEDGLISQEEYEQQRREALQRLN